MAGVHPFDQQICAEDIILRTKLEVTTFISL